MTTSTPIEFYDLVPYAGGPFFSPATTRARLALLHKRVPFEVVELTYKQLRTGPYRELAGAGDDGVVTAPIIKRPDGTYLRDSLAIMQWLDEAYPDSPSVVAPSDVSSEEYSKAYDAFLAFRGEVLSGSETWEAHWTLYCVPLCAMLDSTGQDNDFEYWTSAARIGEGSYDACVTANADPASKAALVERVNVMVDKLDAILEKQEWLQGPDGPGIKDFHVMGTVRMTAATSRVNYDATFGRAKPGRTSSWISRMNERYAHGELPGVGMADVIARDAKA